MASTSANKNVVVVNDEVTSFEQYYEESLMEIWFKMQGSTWFNYKRLFNGVSTWFRLFLDA
jgi:hypothetical protein